MRDLDDVLAVLERLERKVDALTSRTADRRLRAFLRSVRAYSLASAWSARELLDDARRDRRRDVLDALSPIVGDDGSPAIRLGRWLQDQVGIPVDGLRLVRVKREARVWLYAVESEE